MQLTSEDRLRFYRRVGLSGGGFILLLSIGMNLFLFFTRVPPEATVSKPQELGDALLPGALAYGEVKRGFQQHVQQLVGTSAVLPVSSYAISGTILPSLPSALALFRDQGIAADQEHLDRVLSKMNVPLPANELGLIPISEKWRSADRTMDFVLDMEKRSLTVSIVGSFGPSSEGRADDVAAIAIADRFINQFNVDRSSFRAPYIVEKQSETGGPSKTYVVWAMSFNGVPLIDANGQPVPGAQVQVGRLSRKALSATFTLLFADTLTRSAYPSATKDSLVRGFLSGGMLPAPKAAKGVKSVAQFVASQEVYVLLPADREHPTYLVPAIYAVWMQPACTGCALMPVPTFLPSVREPEFLWNTPKPEAMKPVEEPASGSGTSVSATSSAPAKKK